MEFIMTVGISASGKSSWARKYGETHGLTVLDSDELRKEFFNDTSDMTKNQQVFDEMWRRTLESMKNGIGVIYCATNLSYRRRANLLANLHSALPSVPFSSTCIVFATPFSYCKLYNSTRKRVVPHWVLNKQIRKFELPLKTEGWDNIVVHSHNGSSTLNELVTIIRDIRNFGDQLNPHHAYSLEEHLARTEMAAQARHFAPDVIIAAKYHDLGKCYTREVDERGIAHYSAHPYVGSYYGLAAGLSYHVCALICYHMKPYKEQEVWEKRCGPTLWKELMELHEADEEAHDVALHSTAI